MNTFTDKFPEIDPALHGLCDECGEVLDVGFEQSYDCPECPGHMEDVPTDGTSNIHPIFENIFKTVLRI